MEDLHRNCSSLLLLVKVQQFITLGRADRSTGKETCALPFRSFVYNDNLVFGQPLLYLFILHDNNIKGANPPSSEENSEFCYTLGRR